MNNIHTKYQFYNMKGFRELLERHPVLSMTFLQKQQIVTEKETV